MAASSGAAILALNWYLSKKNISNKGIQSAGKRKKKKVLKISKKEEPVATAISMKKQLKTINKGYFNNLLKKENQAFGKYSQFFKRARI